MILVVTGSRHWTDYAKIYDTLRALRTDYNVLYHGDAKGADTIAAHAAEHLGFTVHAVPIDHLKDGPWPKAGQNRNRRMLVTAQPNLVVAFRAPGVSNGTDGCIKSALAMNIQVKVIQ